MEQENNAKELSELLKVPLFHTPPPKEQVPIVKSSEYLDELKAILEEPIGVCETCCKVIKRGTKVEPCGNQQCPFGTYQM